MNAQTPNSKAPPLSPRALAFHDVLQAIAAGAASGADIAKATGRPPNNMARDLANLEADGVLVRSPDLTLTEEGRRVLRILATADGDAPERRWAGVTGAQALLHCQIFPDPANPRRDFESPDAAEAIEELASSILQVGRVLQNLVVRPLPPTDAFKIRDAAGAELPLYQLVAGERRWRAIGKLIATDRAAADFPIPVLALDLDDGQAKRLALIENLKRVDLKPLEEARAFKGLVDGGMSTEAIAVEVLGGPQKQRYVQQRLQLLELRENHQAALDDGRLTIKQALEILRERTAPIAITLGQELMFLEIAHAIASKHGPSYWQFVPVDIGLERASDIAGSDAEWLTHFVGFGWDHETGNSKVNLRYSTLHLLRQLTGGDALSVQALTEPLRRARLAATAAQAADGAPQPFVVDTFEQNGRYFTKELNPPFTADPERLAEARNYAAARENQRSEQARHREMLASQEQARKAAGDRLRNLALDFVAPRSAGDLTEALAAIEYPLPWRWTPPTKYEHGFITAANGEDVSLDQWDAGDDLLALVMATMNAAAGMAPEVVERQPDAADDDEDDDDDDEVEDEDEDA